MIPVLIVPVLNRPDLASRLLGSVNFEIGKTVIVDNTPEHDLDLGIDGLTYLRPLTNLGYTGAINAVISQTYEAHWWMWSSNDIVFGPEDLSNIAQLMDKDERARLVTNGFTWGALNRGCVDLAGLFDEWNFWPIYFDDQDYLRRCKLAQVDWVPYQGMVEHGADGHLNSLAIKSDAGAAAGNSRSWTLNHQAYISKWGGDIGREKFDTPWGSGLPLWATKPDPAGRTARRW